MFLIETFLESIFISVGYTKKAKHTPNVLRLSEVLKLYKMHVVFCFLGFCLSLAQFTVNELVFHLP